MTTYGFGVIFLWVVTALGIFTFSFYTKIISPVIIFTLNDSIILGFSRCSIMHPSEFSRVYNDFGHCIIWYLIFIWHPIISHYLSYVWLIYKYLIFNKFVSYRSYIIFTFFALWVIFCFHIAMSIDVQLIFLKVSCLHCYFPIIQCYISDWKMLSFITLSWFVVTFVPQTYRVYLIGSKYNLSHYVSCPDVCDPYWGIASKLKKPYKNLKHTVIYKDQVYGAMFPYF